VAGSGVPAVMGVDAHVVPGGLPPLMEPGESADPPRSNHADPQLPASKPGLKLTVTLVKGLL
jgi:hypothetical protein